MKCEEIKLMRDALEDEFQGCSVSEKKHTMSRSCITERLVREFGLPEQKFSHVCLQSDRLQVERIVKRRS